MKIKIKPRKHWYYHPESDCLFMEYPDAMGKRTDAGDGDACLCEDLGIAITETKEEGKRLLKADYE